MAIRLWTKDLITLGLLTLEASRTQDLLHPASATSMVTLRNLSLLSYAGDSMEL